METSMNKALTFKEKMYNRAGKLNIILDDHQLNQFEKYYHILIEQNKVMNLTSITDEDQVIDKHFIDSLTCVRVIDLGKCRKVIDVGTGAGFPGIPLKIAFPHLHFTLLDSLNKRIKFLNELTSELDLYDIMNIHGRAEEYAHKKEFRESYDMVVSRAVANLSTLTEYCIPFLKVNRYFISYKSKKGQEEIKNAGHCFDLLGCKIEESDEFYLNDNDNDRLLIKIKKCKNTPGKYPRKAGIPSREPL